MKTQAFIFDYVSIPPDRQIGKHSHSCWELSYVACGRGVRTIGDLSHSFKEGEIILITPGIVHVWKFDPDITDASGNISNISVFFEPGLISTMKYLFPEISEPIEKIESLEQAVYYNGQSYIEILKLLLSMQGLTAEERFPIMIKLLLSIADTSESRFAGKGHLLSRPRQRLEKVRIYCACNYARQITLDEMSRHVGMNKSSFCSFMRKQTGMTLSEYINNVRLDRAKEKLKHTDYNISEIALSCGFQNVTYFNRLFRARFGTTPKSIRVNESET